MKLISVFFPKHFFILVMVTLISCAMIRPALAVCPLLADTSFDSTLRRVNLSSDVNRRTIYFCKQSFNSSSLTYRPTESELVTGGSRAISQGDTIQIKPLTSSIDLTGFSPTDLGLNQLNANFPNVNGEFDSPSLFNFYTRATIRRRASETRKETICNREYQRIKNYLSNNAVFQASGSQGVQTSSRLTGGDNIAQINDALLIKSNNKNILSNITFYHANANKTGQFFTRPHRWRLSRRFLYCWVGVGARLSIDSETANLQQAGDYTVDIGVVTR